ncbi:hypothetical protein [Limibacillus halophilus]|uniref:Leucyl aminopeptidase (Aminopeptidase T) n=1 Tax=Limibacillus halophilus TaxID=1579333 RepID=A0A839SWW4_9PROT|nr:hypothetical protein [Limibacillus halophilus]MBB3066992.1 leucyl aminopeptidase (aminopeptidase T) [Limibacillus halophilus]
MTPGPELRIAADTLVVDYMNVDAGEEVLITVDTMTDPDAAAAVFASVLAAGAKPAMVQVPQVPFQGGLADRYLPEILTGAVEKATVWIDLTFPYLAGSGLHDHAMKSNSVRYLLAGDIGSGGIRRLFGDVDLDRFQRAFDVYNKILCTEEGAEIRVTNPLGTDVTFRLGKAAYEKPRRATKPGTYLVPGSCTIFPEIETVKGRIVAEAGFHEYFTAFASPLIIDVDGRIASVTGGGWDRGVLDRSLRRAGGGDYGYVIHFTFALHPAARFTGASFIEDSRVHGMNAVGLGLPWWVPGGGENHPDVVVSEQSIYLNGVLLIRDGIAIAPQTLVDAQRLLCRKAGGVENESAGSTIKGVS